MERKDFVSHGIPIIQCHVQTDEDAAALDRPRGRYVTLETGPLSEPILCETVCACLTEQLRPFLEPFFGKVLCVCAMGNQETASDSLGPEVAKRFLPQMYGLFIENSNFKQIAVISPGTGGQTNLPTDTIVKGVVSAIGAGCVLVIDAGVCTEADRLCGSISITDSGMSTYHKTAFLCQSTIGVPVVTVSVPTVIRLPGLEVEGQELLLTHFHIEDVIKTASFIIACSLTQLSYPEFDYESCKQGVELCLNNIM